MQRHEMCQGGFQAHLYAKVLFIAEVPGGGHTIRSRGLAKNRVVVKSTTHWLETQRDEKLVCQADHHLNVVILALHFLCNIEGGLINKKPNVLN